ncbi:MAG: hypothetical protein NVSMB9_26480 [Isosphaeraceae bacterium]
MMCSHDAWTVAVLLAGADVNGELAAVSEKFLPLAELLAARPPGDRLAAFEDFLSNQPDRDAIVRSVADCDPTGPPPEVDPAGGAEMEEWGPIRLGTLPPAEPFPLDVLPEAARQLARAAAESISCPVDFPAVALLAAASGLIGRSVVLKVKLGYIVAGSLYAALVGSPSSGKSPALRAALDPVWSIARTKHAEWRTAMDAWEDAEPGERGEPPESVRVVSTDPTTEALAPTLAKNPRGLIVAPDEMTKWVMSMDQYKGGKGGDRPFYLSAWGGETVFIDRAKNMREPIAVPHPFLTVIGGMTPDMLSTLSEGKGREDGFVARLLFCYPEKIIRRYSEAGIPEEVSEDWKQLATALWSRQFRDLDGQPVPHVIRLAPEASRALTVWCQAHYAEQGTDGFPESMEGPWGKLESYLLRLALILHLMELAADPTRPEGDDLPELPGRIIDDAARLVCYFKAHALRVYATMGGKARDGGDNVRALIRWILANDRSEFSTRDIGRDFDRFKDDPAALADALEWMARHNLIRPQPEPETTSSPRGGRKRSPLFDVNSLLKNSPRFRQFRRNPAT